MSDVSFPSPEEFSDWRRANPTRGKRADTMRCPFAECLRDRGADEPHIYGEWSVDGGNTWRETPEWAFAWIRAFDQGEEINPLNPAKADEMKPGMRLVDGEWLYSAAWL